MWASVALAVQFVSINTDNQIALTSNFMNIECLLFVISLLPIFVDGCSDSSFLPSSGASEPAFSPLRFSSSLGTFSEHLSHPSLVLDCCLVLLPLQVPIQHTLHVVLGPGVRFFLLRLPVPVSDLLASLVPSICGPLVAAAVHALRERELLGAACPSARGSSARL